MLRLNTDENRSQIYASIRRISQFGSAGIERWGDRHDHRYTGSWMKIAILVGFLALIAVLAVGLYVTDFTAYLGNNPATCNNCHVMDAVYEGWYHGGHQDWATCNDCHTPHALIPKYLVKAQSGYHHVTAFIFGEYPGCHSRQRILAEGGARKLHPLPYRDRREYAG